jgi:thiamine-phosphate pyrophosphorylase
MNSQILRILDANANRAREALRVIEDYARFVLNDDQICGTLKQLRHDFAAATAGFSTHAILHRDTPGDVGVPIKTESELHRENVNDVVIAAGKRLGEALRTIEEYAKTFDAPAAATIESLRYRFYDIEQKIAHTLHPAACGLARLRLYVLITENLCNRPWLDAAEQAILGGADALQLREKNLPGGEFLNRARQFVNLCRKHNVKSIINDRPDIALLANADGVHVGQDDLPAIEVRKLIGRDKILGVSTHNLDQAKQAVRDGADYIGVGPIFCSSTKPRDFLPGLPFAHEIFKANLPIPAIAIAGITLENVNEVITSGIGAVAVTAAVLRVNDVRTAAEKFKEKLNRQDAKTPRKEF